MGLDFSDNEFDLPRRGPVRAIRRIRRKELEAEQPGKPFVNVVARLPAGYQAEHERRILAEQERIQRELAQRKNEPDDPLESELRRQAREQQRRARRLQLVRYLAERGGTAAPGQARIDLNWCRRTYYKTAVGEWFEGSRHAITLTTAGWQAAREEGERRP